MVEEMQRMFRLQIVKLREAQKNMEDGVKRLEGSNFERTSFWLHYSFAAQSISHNITTLSIALTTPPLPEVQHVKDLMDQIDAGCTSFVAVYETLGLDQGISFCKTINLATRQILKSLEEYFTTIFREPTNPSQVGEVAVVWSQCSVQELPQSAKEDSKKILLEQNDLMEDAIQELQSELKTQRFLRKSRALRGGSGGGTSGSKWGETEYRRAEEALAVSRAVSRALSRSVRALEAEGHASTNQQISELDRLVDRATTLSPTLDDLVAAVYPPVDVTSLTQQLMQLDETIKRFLDAVESSHFIKDSDKDWIESLREEITNNVKQMEAQLTSEQLLEMANLSIENANDDAN